MLAQWSAGWQHNVKPVGDHQHSALSHRRTPAEGDYPELCRSEEEGGALRNSLAGVRHEPSALSFKP
jgi:hypothetical protein